MANKGRPGRGNCGVCKGANRIQVDIALVNGMSCRAVGDKFGLSCDCVERHAKRHLPPQARAALLVAQHPSVVDLDQLKVSESEGLLSHVIGQRSRLHSLSELALEMQDVKAAVSVEAAIGSNLQLSAKLLGQLTTVVDHRTTNLMLSPSYLQLREALVTALRGFPDAAIAVARVLHRLESDAATDITARATKPSKQVEHRLAAPVMIDAEDRTAGPIRPERFALAVPAENSKMVIGDTDPPGQAARAHSNVEGVADIVGNGLRLTEVAHATSVIPPPPPSSRPLPTSSPAAPLPPPPPPGFSPMRIMPPPPPPPVRQ